VLADSFKAVKPGVNFRMEAAGSLETIRKVTELGRTPDIVASADVMLINELLIPEFASWSLPFASNEMVIAFSPNSKKHNEINADNWHQILQSPDIAIGRSNPDLDPCGYRTVLLLKLAEKYYGISGFAGKVLENSRKNIRPKETDLVALLQTGHLDYIFIYNSTVVQHNLKSVSLPDQINLANGIYEKEYSTAQTRVRGRKPGDFITIDGKTIIYGLTTLDKAPYKAEAEQFVAFIMSRKGQEILSALGHRKLAVDSLPIGSKVPQIIRNQLVP
jgi:molybdate/tungstate transport system substrate-binding protein